MIFPALHVVLQQKVASLLTQKILQMKKQFTRRKTLLQSIEVQRLTVAYSRQQVSISLNLSSHTIYKVVLKCKRY